MKTVARFSLPFLLVAGLVALALILGARFTMAEPSAPAVAPAVMNYQGYLTDDDGAPYDGQANFQFGIFAASAGGSAIWDETHNGVTVSGGYFNVLLGSTDPLSAVDFSDATRYLGVDVDTGSGYVSLPRQRLGAVPYALQAQVASAAPWSGLTGVPAGFADGIDGVEYDNVIAVSKSGGDFTTIQAAINSVSDAGIDNRYLIWVGPGIYSEQVILKDDIYLFGAGQGLTIITSHISNPDIYPPEEGTLHLASSSEVRNISVVNEGTGYRNVAILGATGVGQVKLSQITVSVIGSGQKNFGIFLHSETTSSILIDLDVDARNGALVNVALANVLGAYTVVEGGNYTAHDGNLSIGIDNSGSHLTARSVTVSAHEALLSHGLLNTSDGSAVLDGGRFTATRGLTETTGISNNGAFLEANSVVATGRNGQNWNHGLSNDGGIVYLLGGYFYTWGGTETYGILNLGYGRIEATSITANAGGGLDRNDGLRNEGGAIAKVTASSLTGRDGKDNRGAANYEADSTLDLNQVAASGEGGGELAVRVGVSNEADGLAFITNSELWGDRNSFLAQGAISRIYLSRLIGGPVAASGDVKCFGVIWDNSFYAESCPIEGPP
jgi:hypothetical protein